MIANQAIQCTAIPVFNDNYIWLLIKGSDAYIVDPGLAEPVMAFLKKHALNPAGILITHSHSDHIGGISALVAQFDTLPVIGPMSEKIPQITQPVFDGDHVDLWPDTTLEVISVPGHMPEHVAYFVKEATTGWKGVFCGDALFSSGCGRIFEGTPEAFYHSLIKLRGLPESTLVFCAHEYTLANIAFARHIEADNPALIEKQHACERKRRSGHITLPSTMANEKETNPFLRCHISALRARASELAEIDLNSDIDTFTALRKLKDRF